MRSFLLVLVLVPSVLILSAGCAQEPAAPRAGVALAPAASPAPAAAVPAGPAPAASAPAASPAPAAVPATTVAAEKCEHGVSTALCARCNPKLAPAFKAKNDWCAEHERPESQCALCNPELAQAGVK